VGKYVVILLYWYYRSGERLHKAKALCFTYLDLFYYLLSNKGDKGQHYLLLPFSSYTEIILTNWFKLLSDTGPRFTL